MGTAECRYVYACKLKLKEEILHRAEKQVSLCMQIVSFLCFEGIEEGQ